MKTSKDIRPADTGATAGGASEDSVAVPPTTNHSVENRSLTDSPVNPSGGNTPLSPAEQQKYEFLCEDIKKKPRTAEAIGEPLWTIEHENLYRGVVGSMETFFPVVLGIDPEEGFKLIADWEAMTGHAASVAEPPRQSAPVREPLPDVAPDNAKPAAKGKTRATKVGSHSKQAATKATKRKRMKSKTTRPVIADVPETAQGHKRRYLQVNERIKVLLPGTLELCALLYEVKEDELYLYADPSYRSFQEWAAAEHKLAKSSFYQYLKSGRIYKLLTESTDVDSKPENQAQLRPLLSLEKKPKQVIKVWSMAVQLASVEPSAGHNITESTVAKAKRMVLGRTTKAAEPKTYPKRLEKALAAVWKVWPPEEKDQFVYALFDHLCDCFYRLDADEFDNEDRYRWFKQHLPMPKEEKKAVENAAQPGGNGPETSSAAPAPKVAVSVPKPRRGQELAKKKKKAGGGKRSKKADKPEPVGPTVAEVLDRVLGHLQDISESYESQRDNLPENLQGSSKDDELSEKAEAIQQVSGHLEDVISGLDENDDVTYDEDGNESDGGKCDTSDIRVKPPRFLESSRPKEIGRLIEIIEAVASAVEPQDPQAAEKISEVAADLEAAL